MQEEGKRCQRAKYTPCMYFWFCCFLNHQLGQLVQFNEQTTSTDHQANHHGAWREGGDAREPKLALLFGLPPLPSPPLFSPLLPPRPHETTSAPENHHTPQAQKIACSAAAAPSTRRTFRGGYLSAVGSTQTDQASLFRHEFGLICEKQTWERPVIDGAAKSTGKI